MRADAQQHNDHIKDHLTSEVELRQRLKSPVPGDHFIYRVGQRDTHFHVVTPQLILHGDNNRKVPLDVKNILDDLAREDLTKQFFDVVGARVDYQSNGGRDYSNITSQNPEIEVRVAAADPEIGQRVAAARLRTAQQRQPVVVSPQQKTGLFGLFGRSKPHVASATKKNTIS